MKRLLVAGAAGVAALVCLGGPAQAQRMSTLTGSQLIQLCTGSDRAKVQGCEAYIDGIADTTAFYQRLRPEDGSKGALLPGYICVPGSTTGVQLRQTVVDWFHTHPDQAQKQASGVVLQGLDETYPCKGTQHVPEAAKP